jgi:hypothetical protein
MNAEPERDWLREKEVLTWQPWLTHHLLQQFINDGQLKLKIGDIPTNCDVWQRRPGRRFARFYRTSKIKQICNGN